MRIGCQACGVPSEFAEPPPPDYPLVCDACRAKARAEQTALYQLSKDRPMTEEEKKPYVAPEAGIADIAAAKHYSEAHEAFGRLTPELKVKFLDTIVQQAARVAQPIVSALQAATAHLSEHTTPEERKLIAKLLIDNPPPAPHPEQWDDETIDTSRAAIEESTEGDIDAHLNDGLPLVLALVQHFGTPEAEAELRAAVRGFVAQDRMIELQKSELRRLHAEAPGLVLQGERTLVVGNQQATEEALTICASLERVGLLDAVRDVVRLLDGHGRETPKGGDQRWHSKPTEDIYRQMMDHAVRGFSTPPSRDPDSDMLDTTHAATRALMLAARSIDQFRAWTAVDTIDRSES